MAAQPMSPAEQYRKAVRDAIDALTPKETKWLETRARVLMSRVTGRIRAYEWKDLMQEAIRGPGPEPHVFYANGFVSQ
jgi:hypothetical protein